MGALRVTCAWPTFPGHRVRLEVESLAADQAALRRNSMRRFTFCGAGRRHAPAREDVDLPRLTGAYHRTLSSGAAQRDLVERQMAVAAVRWGIRDEVAVGVVHGGADRDVRRRRPREPNLDEVGARRHGEGLGVRIAGRVGQGDPLDDGGRRGVVDRRPQRDGLLGVAGVLHRDGGRRHAALRDTRRPAREVALVGRHAQPGTTCPA